MPTILDTSITGRFRFFTSSENEARSLGSQLKRILLNDIAGMAAVAARIDGVSHEYQAIPGVREDALELINNLKKIRISSAADVTRASLDTTCSEVEADELNLEAGSVINPDHVIARLSPGARLRMDVIFERGTGYKKPDNAPEGFIPLAANFNPVLKVAVDPKQDSLDIRIETDGGITPEAALREAIEKAGVGGQIPPTISVSSYEMLPVEPVKPKPEVELGPEFYQDPFDGTPPPDPLDVVRESYADFLNAGIPKVLEQLFPLTSRDMDEVRVPDVHPRTYTKGRRLDLIDYRLEMPDITPEQCVKESRTYEARLIIKTRLRRGALDGVYSSDYPRAVQEEEIDMGPIPLMTEDGGFVIYGGRKTCVMLLDQDMKLRRIGDIMLRELENLISRMKPILEDRLNATGELSSDILKLLPFSVTLTDLLVTSQLCQWTDETNVLAQLTHRTRVASTALIGEQIDEDVRMLKMAHFGRLGYMETPEGPNIGLIHTLSPYVKIAEDGSILTPYRKVNNGKVTGEIIYLSIAEEAGFRIADSTSIGPDGSFREDMVLVREGNDLRKVTADKVDLIAVSRIQQMSHSTALIPFLGHDDSNRALFASNMQRQAVPLVNPEQPLIKTGVEGKIAKDSGQMVLAKRAGKVIEVTGMSVVVLTGKERDTYNLLKFYRTNQATCINQTPIVEVGQEVSAGQVLADTSSTRGGELALGRNVLVAYMPFKGYNFEDAICISDELVHEEAFTSVNIEWAGVSVDPDKVWIAPVGSRVKPGDVLVQEKAGRKRTLLPAPAYNPVVVIDCVRTRDSVHLFYAQTRNISIGDKFAGRHGNKGCIARILPRSEMPYMEDGTPVQMVLNTLGVVSRMNVGQILETHFGALASALGTQFILPPFPSPSLLAGVGGSNGFPSPSPLAGVGGSNGFPSPSPLAGVGGSNGFPSPSPLAGEGRGEGLLQSKLREAGLSENGMVTLYDGGTGRPFESPVTVGWLYMLKLAHMVDDKMHAFSTGTPSMLIHQPSVPRSGNRIGFLEMWALDAYNADHNLQEMLTIKSDDAEGRERAALALLAGKDVEPAGEGLSLQLIENTLRGLGICVEEDR